MLAGLCLVSTSCVENRPEIGFEDLHGRFVADPGIYVLPDRGWRREGVRGGSFRRSANLLVLLKDDQPQGLRIRYVPEGETINLRFLASWDEKPLWAAPRSASDSELVAEIPASELSPGLHRVRLERVKEPDRSESQAVARCFFDRLVVERIDDGAARPVAITANGFPARFLDFGVTSNTSEQLSGCLFVGGRRHSIEVSGDSDGIASFFVLNQSKAPARFAARIDDVEVGGLDVPPRSREPFSFPVPSGRRTVTLIVEAGKEGFFLWGAPHLNRSTNVDRPPVFLITLDTTRRDAVAPYSGRSDVTPTLEAFARTASVYTNAYAAAPWTLPSHASIFTGLFPSHHRAGVSEDVLARSHTTLAELFRHAGYRTGGFVGGSMASSRFGLAQGFDVFVDPKKTEEPGNVIADAAMDFVARYPGDPLFAFLNFFDPHGSYSAPIEFQKKLDVHRLAEPIQGVPGWGAYARNERGAWSTVVNGQAPESAAGLAYMRARYDAEVAFMDHQLGRFFAALRERDLFDESLIVIVSDHGEFMGERGLFAHSYRLDTELTWVPLLIKWPRQSRARTVDALVSHVDLFPAVLAAADLEFPASDGIAFGPGSVGSLGERKLVLMEEHRSRFHQLPGPFWIADHLAGLQQLQTREVLFSGQVACSQRQQDFWLPSDCEASWDDRFRELPDWLQASMLLDVDVSTSDLDESEVAKLKALGYLQ